MKPKALALLSGGLDSTLAACLVHEQGVALEAVYFQPFFECPKGDADQTAARLGIPIRVLPFEDDYFEVIHKPRYGYGRGMNPCVDCRIYMFQKARQWMKKTGASFLVTGEVVEQRPMSQKYKDLLIVDRDSGLTGKVLRPLSAHRLPLTEPEKSGWVDRSKLFGIVGRSRQKQLVLAKRFGLESSGSASAGCSLTSPLFSKRIRDIFDHQSAWERWEWELLKIGRHFRLDPQTRVILARNEEQGEMIERLHPRGTVFLKSRNFGGPCAMLIGRSDSRRIRKAGALMLRYAKKPLPRVCEIVVRSQDVEAIICQKKAASLEAVDRVRIV